MSLLTRIYDLKSKHKTASGNIAKERALIGGLTPKMEKAEKAYTKFQKGDYAKASETFTSTSRSFVETYGTASNLETFDAGFENADDLNDFYGDIYETHMEGQWDKFKKTSGFKDYAMWKNYAASGGGRFMEEIYNRAAQGRADYDALVRAPTESMNEVVGTKEKEGTIGRTGKAYQTASDQLQTYYDTYTGYKDDIDEANKRMLGYGASQHEIQGMMSSAQHMYGLSTEQRKTGTRGSARRRSMLTSRSGYA